MVFDLNTLKKAEVNPNEPHMRLLVCRKCKSIEEVSQYDGPEGGENSAEYDHYLRFFVDQHMEKACKKDDWLVYHLPTKYWIIPKVKEAIIEQIKEGAKGLDVFGTQFYDTKSNFSADAMNCWMREHNQTRDCADYKSEKKILKPGTEKERMALGMEKESSGPKVYLCDYCPVKSIVQEKAFKKKRLYD